LLKRVFLDLRAGFKSQPHLWLCQTVIYNSLIINLFFRSSVVNQKVGGKDMKKSKALSKRRFLALVTAFFLQGCTSPEHTITWNINAVETELALIEATPVEVISTWVIGGDKRGKSGLFTLNVLNKTEQRISFYPLQLHVSAVNEPIIAIYLDSFGSHSRRTSVTLEPKEKKSVDVRFPLADDYLKFDLQLKLQTSKTPITKLVE